MRNTVWCSEVNEVGNVKLGISHFYDGATFKLAVPDRCGGTYAQHQALCSHITSYVATATDGRRGCTFLFGSCLAGQGFGREEGKGFAIFKAMERQDADFFSKEKRHPLP